MRKLLNALLVALLLSAVFSPTVLAGSYTPIGSPGTISRSNGSVTPGLPTGWAAGNLCVLLVMSQLTASDVITDPSGWTVLANRGTHSKLYGRIMVGGDTAPTISFSQSNGHISQIECFSGNVYTDLSTIVHTSNTSFSSSATVPSIPNITISQADTLVIIAGSHLKTATSNGSTYDDVASFTEIAEERPSGSLMDFVWNYSQQTTATSLSGVTRTMTGTTESGQVVGLSVSLKSTTAPTFTVSPAIGTRTTSSIPVTATTACTDCTFYGASYTDGNSTPTCAAIIANTVTGGFKYFSQAMTATVQGTGTFSSITDGTVKDSAYCLNSTANGESAVATLADIYKLPSTSVTFSSCSATGCTYNVTLDGPGNIYGVACKKGSTAATVTQVEAGNCTGNVAAVAAANKAVTGADTLTIGSALDFPTHDFDIVGTYGGQHESTAHADDDRLKIAPTGTVYTRLASVGSGSFCSLISSPAPAANDIIEADSATSPSAFLPTYLTDCHFSYDGDSTRQKLCYRLYDDSGQGWMAGTGSPSCTGTRFALWINDHAPVFDDGATSYQFSVGSSVNVDICARATDDEGDALLGSITGGSLLSGLSLDANGVLTGNPDTESETGMPVTVRCTDIAGGFDEIGLNLYALDTITNPNVVNLPVAEGEATLTAHFLDPEIAGVAYSNTIAVGNIISQSPLAGTEQEPGTIIYLTVSLGSVTGLNSLGTIFLPDATPVPATAVFRAGQAYAQTGERYVANWPASGSVVYQRGLAYRQDGAMTINVGGTIATYVRGIAVTSRGETVADTCTPIYAIAGIPMIANGTVCMTDIN